MFDAEKSDKTTELSHPDSFHIYKFIVKFHNPIKFNFALSHIISRTRQIPVTKERVYRKLIKKRRRKERNLRPGLSGVPLDVVAHLQLKLLFGQFILLGCFPVQRVVEVEEITKKAIQSPNHIV